jgi:hypothetical protein
MPELASFAGSTGRPHDHRHAPDSGHVEPAALAARQSRSLHDLDFGQLIVPVADAIDGLRAEENAAPEFTGFEFRSCDNAAKYMSIAPAACQTPVLVRLFSELPLRSHSRAGVDAVLVG